MCGDADGVLSQKQFTVFGDRALDTCPLIVVQPLERPRERSGRGGREGLYVVPSRALCALRSKD